MKYLDLSERLERDLFFINDNKDFNAFKNIYDDFINIRDTLKISDWANFARYFNIDKKLRMNFVFALTQLKQWRQDVNIDLKNNRTYMNKMRLTLNSVSIVVLDTLSQMDINLTKDNNTMEDQVYNTGELTYHQKENFKKFLDDTIGTDFEEESFDGGKYTLTVFDLTPKEVRKIREFENTKLDEPYEKFCAIWKLRKEDATTYRSEWMDDYVKAENLLGEVVDKLGLKLDPYQMFDFRMIETNIKSEQYKQGALLKYAKEISIEKLKAFSDSVKDDYTIQQRINALHIVERGESSHDFNELAKDGKEKYKGYEVETIKSAFDGITYYHLTKNDNDIKVSCYYFYSQETDSLSFSHGSLSQDFMTNMSVKESDVAEANNVAKEWFKEKLLKQNDSQSSKQSKPKRQRG